MKYLYRRKRAFDSQPNACLRVTKLKFFTFQLFAYSCQISQTTILEIVLLLFNGNISNLLRNLFLPALSILSVRSPKLRLDIGLSAIAATSCGPMREKPRTKLRRGIYLANRAVSVAWNCDSCPIVLKQSEMSPVDLISGYGNYFHLRDLCLPPLSAPHRRRLAQLLVRGKYPRRGILRRSITRRESRFANVY